MALPKRPVVALVGDGSSLYSIQALWSAAQLELPITFVILKNRRYAALPEFAPAFGFRPDEPLPLRSDGPRAARRMHRERSQEDHL